ncbi:MAG: hypothetical protein JJ974_03120 [Phycisphaerales bacterium]|nr:hypothetical protein [Phycisphaerales bacterium]
MTSPLLRRSCALSVGLSVLAAANAAGELVVFENTNPDLETLTYYQGGNGLEVLGQSLDVTRSAHDQPALGELPVGSFMIAWFQGNDRRFGDWIWMGTGRSTLVAQADEFVDVIDPKTNFPVGYRAPGDFDDGSEIGEDSNWAFGWVAMHTSIPTAPTDEGVYFTDETFTIGLQFLMDDGFHYGFAELSRTAFDPNDPLSIEFRAVRWGYETTAGVGVPSVGSAAALLMGLGGVRRRR